MAFREDRSNSFSAPATLERKKTQSFLKSAKEIFKKPWRQRSQRKSKQPKRRPHKNVLPAPKEVPFDPHNNNPFRQGFPNFQNRLAPIGGYSPKVGRSVDEEYAAEKGEATTNAQEDIEIPDSKYAARPSLKNILPMFDSAADSKSKTTPAISTPPVTARTPAAPPSPAPAPQVTTPTLPVTTPPQAAKLTPKIPATTPDTIALVEVTPPSSDLPRRNSTPMTSPSHLKARHLDDRRPSASSDTSSDNSRQGRRDRRASLTRDLPLLPKRGQDPFQHSPSPPPVAISPYSEYSGPLLALSNPDSDHRQRPPVGPGGGGGGGGEEGGPKLQSSYSFPPMWPKPQHQLQELEEELEEDGEGDGEEDTSASKIDEVPSSTDDIPSPTPLLQLPPPPLAMTPPEPAPPVRKDSKDMGGGGGGGFGKALKGIMSKRKNDPTPPPNPGKGKKGGKGKEKDEEDPAIKGFDDFFMY